MDPINDGRYFGSIPNPNAVGILVLSRDILISINQKSEEERPHMTKRSTTSCEKEYDTYCFNNGQCILLEDMKEHHCKCKKGFYGPRCATPELVGRPVDEEQVVVILFSVTLLMIGLGGALYFFYNRRKRGQHQRFSNISGVKFPTPPC
uniref:Proepiregulin-like n=1 Tax=Poecilia reticulata TaxID=8081 RepID=A0A3P9NVZ8_POERE